MQVRVVGGQRAVAAADRGQGREPGLGGHAVVEHVLAAARRPAGGRLDDADVYGVVEVVALGQWRRLAAAVAGSVGGQSRKTEDHGGVPAFQVGGAGGRTGYVAASSWNVQIPGGRFMSQLVMS